MQLTNKDIKQAFLAEGMTRYQISAMLKDYFKNPIRVEDVSNPQQRDKPECGNCAVIVPEKVCDDKDMEETVKFAEGIFI